MRLLVLSLIVLVGCGDNVHQANDGSASDASGMDSIDAPVPCVAPSSLPPIEAVATGTLDIDAASTIASLALTVPFDRTLLVVSMSEDEPSPQFGAAMCELLAADAGLGTPNGLVCRRNNAGTDNPASTGVVHIRYTLITFTSGVSVQRGHVNTGFVNPSVVSLTPVDPGTSFIVLGGMLTGGTGWGSNEFVRAALLDAQTLDIRTNVMGSQVTWQVVTMAGASVKRGFATMASTDLHAEVAATTPTRGTIALASYETDNTTSIAASKIMVRLSMAGSVLALDRSDSGAGVDASWEIVTLPYWTRQITTTLAAGEASKMDTVAGLSSNSVALATSQAILATSGGSTTYEGTLADLVGEAAATLSLGAGSVTLERGTNTAASTITWNAIDFSRDRCAN